MSLTFRDLEVVHPLQAFSYGIVRTHVQQLIRFRHT